MRAALILFALLAAPATGQQALCDYTAEADAADIDGLELLMGDPLNSCEGYSVAFTDFVAAVETVITPGFDALSSGTNTTAAMVVGTGASLATSGTGSNVSTSLLNTASGGGWGIAPDATFPANVLRIYGTSANRQVHFGAATGTAQIEINVAGSSRDGVYVQGGAWVAKTTPTATTPNLVPNANSDPDTGIGWDATSGGMSIIDESTSLLLATTTGDGYVMVRGCKHFGAMAAPPAVTTPSECDEYTDTDDGSGNAAKCVYLDGAWAKIVGAGNCS